MATRRAMLTLLWEQSRAGPHRLCCVPRGVPISRQAGVSSRRLRACQRLIRTCRRRRQRFEQMPPVGKAVVGTREQGGQLDQMPIVIRQRGQTAVAVTVIHCARALSNAPRDAQITSTVDSQQITADLGDSSEVAQTIRGDRRRQGVGLHGVQAPLTRRGTIRRTRGLALKATDERQTELDLLG